MTFKDWIRQIHRWLGITLTVTILMNFVAMTFGAPPAVIVYAPLAPFGLLVISGLYMFASSYGSRGRSLMNDAHE